MSTATQMAIMTPVLLGFSALAIDSAWLHTSRMHLQDVADSAALAGVSKLGNATDVRSAAARLGAANSLNGNTVTIGTGDVQIGTWNGSTWTDDANGDYVRVTARRTAYPTFLAGVFGNSTVNLAAVAIATTSDAMTGTWPCIMFADQTFEFNGSAVVTGYNSETNTVEQAGVCGNMSTIRLQGNYSMYADVHGAPPGNVVLSGSSLMVGDDAPLPERVNLPRHTMPNTGRTFPASLNAHDSVTLTGGTPYRMPSGFSTNGQAVINVNNGPVEIYAAGTVTINGGGFANTTQDPHNLIIHMIGAGSIHINGNSTFYGVIDAPDSEVELNGNAAFYGAITGRVIHHNGNQDVHLDTSLGDMLGSNVTAPSLTPRLVY